MVSSYFSNLSKEHFGEFEKHTKGIGSKLLKEMRYHGHGLSKCSQGMLNPIVATPWAKHEGLGFNGKMDNSMSMKTTFVKGQDRMQLASS